MTPLPETNFEVGTPVEGDISSEGEEDEYSINLFAGRIYVFKTELMTLGDSTLTLLGTDGLTQLAFNDDFPHIPFVFLPESRLVFVPPVSGVYFVEVAGVEGGFDSPLGTYVLTATEVVAERITVDSSAFDDISNAYEEDWFTVGLEGGVSYIIEAVAEGLNDTLLALMDTDGQTELAFNDDGCPLLAARMVITAPSSGAFFVTVFGISDSTGTYELIPS